MKPRGRFQGMLTILRFNWPLYLAAAAILPAAAAGAFLSAAPWLQWTCAAAAAGAVYFILVSLGVSHLVYDRSGLYRGSWCERALAGNPARRMVICHAGFDEVSEGLTARFSPESQVILDHYDPVRMTEPSIRRARRAHPPTADTVAAPFDRWPVGDQSADVIFGLLAIHEFRNAGERVRWFREARRCLRPGGRIVLAEHLRNAANFIAFGPGFLHFHSAATWKKSWEQAGLECADEFPVTPWVRLFVITSP